MAAFIPHSHAAHGLPSAWVARFAPLAPSGEVLDLACGGGRHALLFAGLGHSVLAVDRDPAALQALQASATAAGLRSAAIRTHAIDLERSEPGSDDEWPFEAARFAAIVVTNYLHRPLLPHLLVSLAPGGVLIYETFAVGNAAFGKPSNPAFLLQPGELLRLAQTGTPPLRVIAYEDGFAPQPAPAMVQRVCAMKAPSPDPSSAGVPLWTPEQLRL